MKKEKGFIPVPSGSATEQMAIDCGQESLNRVRLSFDGSTYLFKFKNRPQILDPWAAEQMDKAEAKVFVSGAGWNPPLDPWQ